MGNALALCTVGDDKQSKKGSLLKEKRILQVIKVDGKILEFKNPVIVRDLLISYPNFYVGMFNKATQGLPLDHKLKVGKIYYLLPSVVDHHDHDHDLTTTSNEKHQNKNDVVVRRETDVTTMKTATTTTTTTTTTIKVVVTKEQLQQILCNKQGSVEELLLGVVAANNNKKVLSENCSSSTWLPKLESIPEGTCELVC